MPTPEDMSSDSELHEARTRRLRRRRMVLLLLATLVLAVLGLKFLSSTRDLQMAVITNDVSAARWALRFGGDANYQQRFGWDRSSLGQSLLFSAADRGNLEMVRLLLDGGADVNLASREDCRPLVGAIRSGNLDIVRLLIDAGAVRSSEIEMASAVGIDRRNVVRFLLDEGASIDAPCSFNDPPLHYAVRLREIEMVRFLLDNGADPLLKAKYGSQQKTPWQIAVDEIATVDRRVEEQKKRSTTDRASPAGPPMPTVPPQETAEEYIRPWREIIDLLDARSNQSGGEAEQRAQ